VTSIKELSDTTKGLMYLGSLLVAVAVGAVATYKTVERIAVTPDKVAKLEEALEASKARLTEVEGRLLKIESINHSQFVSYGDEVALRSFASKNHALGVSGEVDLDLGDPRGGSLGLTEYQLEPTANQSWTVKKANVD
jgi:hypothetical protein